jgi:hypothetical protein
MRTRLFGNAGPGIGYLNDSDSAFAPPGNAYLIAGRIVGTA